MILSLFTRSLTGTLLVAALLWPASAFAVTFNMPSPGTIMLATVDPGTAAATNYIIYQRTSDSRCYFFPVAGSNTIEEDVTINGTTGADVFIEMLGAYSGGTWTYPTFCGETVHSKVPNWNQYRLEVKLGDGADVAFLKINTNHTIIRGGAGNDFLRYSGTGTHHPGPALYGDDGADYLYTGWYLAGGSGNDIMCAPSPSGVFVWQGDGGSGTDTYCGDEIGAGGASSIERNRNSNYCPSACQGLFGW